MLLPILAWQGGSRRASARTHVVFSLRSVVCLQGVPCCGGVFLSLSGVGAAAGTGAAAAG